MPWWKPTAASRMAIPKVPRISTYTPILEMLPGKLTPAALTIVWTASRSGVKNRIVLGSAALILVPQRLGAVRPLRWQAPTKQQPGSPRSPPTRAVVLNFGTAPCPLCALFRNGVEPRLRWRRPLARHRDHLKNPPAARCVAGPPWLRPWSAAGRGSPSFGVVRLPCCAVTGHLQLHHRCEQGVQNGLGSSPRGNPAAESPCPFWFPASGGRKALSPKTPCNTNSWLVRAIEKALAPGPGARSSPSGVLRWPRFAR